MEIDLMQIFKMGIDYGQLLMEQERDGEDFIDAFQGHIIDIKYSMPSAPVPRRQPHSDEWRRAKLDSLYHALDIIGQARQSNELISLKTID